MSVQICERCKGELATCAANGVSLCWVCARAMGLDEGMLAYAGQGDLEGSEGLAPGAAQGAGSTLRAASPDPGGAVKETAKAVQKTADTIKTVAIAGAVLGLATLGYVLYKGVKMQANAAHTLAEHPEVLRAAMIP